MGAGVSKPDKGILKQWAIDRNKGRKDIFFLCNEILGYKDINRPIHGQMANNVQKFHGCDEIIDPDNGSVMSSTPRVPLWELKGNRRTLTLAPRGSLKTTFKIAHSIQWILNYPDVRILWNMSADTRAREIATEILSHFRFNEKFRFYYPEYCPAADKAADWGSMEYFNVPNRKVYRRAPTVSFASVGKIIAGPHYEVVIHSDIVDKNNCNTAGGLQSVLNHFRFCIPLLESSEIKPYTGWCDIEGTVYDFGDVYSHILEMKASGHPEWQVWSVVQVDAEADSKNKVSYWPSRFPWERLMSIKEEVGPVAYSANYRQRPVPEGGGLTDKIDIKSWTKVIKPMLPTMRLHCTIDLHGMEDNLGNDYTVLNVSGFMTNGQVVCLDIRRGHYSPFDVIDLFFELDKTWGGKILDWKIEKDAHARVLAPFLKREMEVRKRWLNIVPLKRDTHTSKPQRIKGLQSWFAGRVLSFSDSIVCLDTVLLEIRQFPKGRHDDILDTLADHMQNREGKVISDVIPAPRQDLMVAPGVTNARFVGFDPETHQSMWSDGMNDLEMAGVPTNWKPWQGCNKAGDH